MVLSLSQFGNGLAYHSRRSDLSLILPDISSHLTIRTTAPTNSRGYCCPNFVRITLFHSMENALVWLVLAKCFNQIQHIYSLLMIYQIQTRTIQTPHQ